MPNKSQIKILENKFGQTRFIYNYCLSNFISNINNLNRTPTIDQLKSNYLVEKKKIDFLKDISPYSEHKVFQNLNRAIQLYKSNAKTNSINFLNFKKKEKNNSFYLSAKEFLLKSKLNSKRKFILFKGLPSPIKIMNKIRFKSKLINATFKKEFGRYFVSLVFEISKEAYENIHKYKFLEENLGVGIDLGLQKTITTSVGLVIDIPNFSEKYTKRIVWLQRCLEKKQHSIIKNDGIKKSENYKKISFKLATIYNKINSKKRDYISKVTSILVRNFSYICMETLDITQLQKNRFFARRNHQLSLDDLSTFIKNKMTNLKNRIFISADKFFPSSKICSKCGSKKINLTLADRVYRCSKCGFEIDRDLNASGNLFKYMKNIIKSGTSKLSYEQIKRISVECNTNKLRFYDLIDKRPTYIKIDNQSHLNNNLPLQI